MASEVAANRAARKYTLNEQIRRVAWGLATPLFRWSPRPFFGWRSLLLRVFGARVGRHVHISPSAAIYMAWNLVIGDWTGIREVVLIYNLGQVTIGSPVTISQRAHLCAGTHDYRREDMPLLKPPITVQDQAWICADAFVGPAVTVGEGAVVGARAVVVRDVEPWSVVAGNPARFIKQREMQGSAPGK